jgi:hypothetical protein
MALRASSRVSFLLCFFGSGGECGATSGVCRRRLLILRLGGVSFGGICSASIGVRFACSFVVGVPASTSLMCSRTAAPVFCSLFRCRSGSGRAWTCSSVLVGGFRSGFFAFFFCDQNGSFLPPYGFFCCLYGCCYWVAFLVEIKDDDARSLLPLSMLECSGRCSFNVLSTAWRTHGVNSCDDSKAWSYSLVSAGGHLPGFNARCFFDMVQSGSERRRAVLFSGHGVAVFVICVTSRILIRKRNCILLFDKI